jgi:hypothetical protein
MSIHRRFAPIGVRFEPEQVAAFTGIYIQTDGGHVNPISMGHASQ